MIVASMRNWLHGEDDDVAGASTTHTDSSKHSQKKTDAGKRVIVVHCKAGKGRSGSMTCSYLISQCGWKPEDALARFTERRMRPQFGAGVSIPSQLRWISYVDRWTRGGKKYVDREVEILEIHVWGLRHGVKVSVEAFADEGKKIKGFHTFHKSERLIVAGDAPGGGGVLDFVGDALSPQGDDDEIHEDADYNEIVNDDGKKAGDGSSSISKNSSPARSESKKGSRTSLLRNRSVRKLAVNSKSKTINPADFAAASSESSTPSGSDANLPHTNSSLPTIPRTNTMASNSEPGGMAVIFKPASPIRIPNSDVCVSLERRNRAPASMGLTMVTAVAHVWFNAFFEGNGPEQDGKADDSGVFEIEWEKMDGIKGSSRKGTKAADKISVVWRTVGAEGPSLATPGVVITEPGEGSPVPQMEPADWKGADVQDPDQGKRLGLRTADPGSESVSKASSIKSQEAGSSASSTKEGVDGDKDSEDESLKGVKSAGPVGEQDADHAAERGRAGASGSSADQGGARTLSEHEKKVEATKGRTENPEEASGAAKSQDKVAEMSAPGLRGGGGGSVGSVGTSRHQPESQHDEGENDSERSGDTTHLGFVKRGKKLLPMHKNKDSSGSGDEREGKDPRLMTAHVTK